MRERSTRVWGKAGTVPLHEGSRASTTWRGLGIREAGQVAGQKQGKADGIKTAPVENVVVMMV